VKRVPGTTSLSGEFKRFGDEELRAVLTLLAVLA
jgi:hypothetical protein